MLFDLNMEGFVLYVPNTWVKRDSVLYIPSTRVRKQDKTIGYRNLS